jgi:hypothetical protein
MADNITSITGVIDKRKNEELINKAESAADEMMANAMGADISLLNTSELKKLLRSSENVFFSQYGPPEHVDKEQLLKAASTQVFDAKFNEATNTFLMTFDDNYNYIVMMNEDFSPKQSIDVLKSLEGEKRINRFIDRENALSMIPDVTKNKYNPKDFLPAPLKTEALAMALKFAESMSQPKIDDFGRVSLQPVDFETFSSNLLERAQYELFNFTTDNNSGYVNVTISGEQSVNLSIKMKESVDPGLMDKLSDVLKEEVSLNHSTYRNHNPELSETIQKMKAAAEAMSEMFPPDPEQDEYMKNLLDNDPEYQRANGNDERADELIAMQNAENVSSITRRR